MNKLIIIFSLVSIQLFCQENTKFNLNIIKAYKNDSIFNGNIVVFFKVTPKEKKDYPPVLSMKFSYRYNEKDPETVVDIQKQKAHNVQLIIYGNNVNKEYPKIYELIEDNVDLKQELMILCFVIKEYPSSNIEDLYIRYGMWEKRNTEKRIEQDFKIKITNDY